MDYLVFTSIVETELEHQDHLNVAIEQAHHGSFLARMSLKRADVREVRTARIDTDGVELFFLELEEVTIREFEYESLAQIRVLKDLCAISMI